MLYILFTLFFITLVFIGNISISTMVFSLLDKKFSLKNTLVVFVASIFYVFVLLLAMRYSYGIVRLLFLYLGFLNYFAISAFLYWLLYLGTRFFKKQNLLRKKKVVFFTFILVPFLVSVYGFYNFFKPITIESITIPSEKITQDYTFLHVSDIQYGSVTREYFQKVI
ncbi:MAG: hypothetical protein ACPGTS_02115, partial [Minisyncoccia bacterium]